MPSPRVRVSHDLKRGSSLTSKFERPFSCSRDGLVRHRSRLQHVKAEAHCYNNSGSVQKRLNGVLFGNSKNVTQVSKKESVNGNNNF